MSSPFFANQMGVGRSNLFINEVSWAGLAKIHHWEVLKTSGELEKRKYTKILFLFLSMHYKRYKFVISKNALLQLEIWLREIESQSMTQNPFFRLDLEGYPDIEMLCHNLLNN